MRAHSARNPARGGYTFLETAIVVSLLGLLMGGFVLSMQRMTGLSSSAQIHHALAGDTMKVMSRIVLELGRSGYVTQAGISYPVFFDDGQPPGGFSVFQHVSPNTVDVAREIVFPLPADGDGDDWPDVTIANAPVWQATTVGYLLVPAPDGSAMLVRQTSDGASRIMARNVTRLQFEDPAQTGFQIPLDTVRVRFSMRRVATDGTVYDQDAERVVRLQNGGLTP